MLKKEEELHNKDLTEEKNRDNSLIHFDSDDLHHESDIEIEETGETSEKVEIVEIAEEAEKTDEFDNDSIFDSLEDYVFSTKNQKDVSVDMSSQTQTFISEYMNFIYNGSEITRNYHIYNGSEITRNYHVEIMKQAQKLLMIFTSLFTGTTIFLCVVITVMIIWRMQLAATLIPLITGAVVDLFTAILIVVMQNLLKSRDDFFKESVKSEHFSKIVGLIQTIKNDSDKVMLISKIVDDYCEDSHFPNCD